MTPCWDHTPQHQYHQHVPQSCAKHTSSRTLLRFLPCCSWVVPILCENMLHVPPVYRNSSKTFFGASSGVHSLDYLQFQAKWSYDAQNCQSSRFKLFWMCGETLEATWVSIHSDIHVLFFSTTVNWYMQQIYRGKFIPVIQCIHPRVFPLGMNLVV